MKMQKVSVVLAMIVGGIVSLAGINCAGNSSVKEEFASKSSALGDDGGDSGDAGTLYNLNINSVEWDNANKPFGGMYITVNQGGVMLMDGYTPFTAQFSAGNYVITAADFGRRNFAHWSDGDTSQYTKSITLSADATYTADYQVGGTIVPLYVYPTDNSGNLVSAWTDAIADKTAYPDTTMIVIANVNNGSGSRVDANWTKAINAAALAGCRVAGYVFTNYGGRTLTAVETQINNWKNFYPNVSSIFFDQMSNKATKESYYTTLTAYVKAHGMDFVIGNPGTDTLVGYVGVVDNLVIYENPGMPSNTFLQGWHTGYSPNNWSYMAYGVAAPFPSSAVVANQPYVAYQYVDDQSDYSLENNYLNSVMSTIDAL